MAKTAGLGDNLYIGGYNISGDVGSIESIHGGPAALMMTGIDKSAFERIGGQRDGGISYTAFFNPSAGQEHVALSGLPTADALVTYCRGTALGNAGCCEIGKEISYDFKRGVDASLSINVDTVANGFGIEWGVQLTAGLRTDVAATNGTGVDTATSVGNSLAFGAQAYLQVTAITGTDFTVKLQDSADNVTFADIAGMAFQQIVPGSIPFAGQRIATINTATIRQYVRAITVTTGGFTVGTFSVVFVKNQIAGVVF